mgnify:CR=1 FL=1
MKALLLLTILFLVSCSHSVHLVHSSDHSVRVDQSKGKKISVEAQQHVIFWFAFDTNYVDEAHDKLKQKCSKGSVKNITTRYSTSHGFFSWYNKINMQGVCFKRG